MAEIANISSAIPMQTSQSGDANAPKDDSLGKMDFLNLLVTQLENQDPMNPSDPTEMTAQLAQYSSLEQLTNISESMEGLDAMKAAYEQNAALSMIGKHVQLDQSSFQLGQDPVQLGYSLEKPASEVQLQVLDQTGTVVDTLEGLSGEAGAHSVQWDGTDQNGEALPQGAYGFMVAAQDSEGNVLQAAPRIAAAVEGVEYGAGGQTLLTSAGPVALNAISHVTQ